LLTTITDHLQRLHQPSIQILQHLIHIAVGLLLDLGCLLLSLAPDLFPFLLGLNQDLLGLSPEREGLIPRAMSAIAANPDGGVLVLIRDTDRAGLSARFGAAPEEDDASEIKRYREIGLGSLILRDLGVREMTLLTDTPQKLVGLEGYGLTVTDWRKFDEESA